MLVFWVQHRRSRGSLAGCLGAQRPFETVFKSISDRLPERGKKKREMKEKKCPNNPPPAPTACAVGPCPTLIRL